MARVKAISNFADDSHKQDDVFDVDGDALQHLIDVDAVVVVADETPLTEKAEVATPTEQTPQAQSVQAAQGQPTVATPLVTTLNEQSGQSTAAGSQPTAEQVAKDAAAADNRTTQV
jgi:hypothetical protein